VSGQDSAPRDKAGLLADIVREVRLVWHLLRDPRVPAWTKLIPFLALVYLVVPIDLIPELAPPVLGQLDDLAVILLGMQLFVSLSPAQVVEELRRKLRFGSSWGEAQRGPQTVDSTARPIDEPPKKTIEGGRDP